MQSKLTIIAGPCAAESLELMHETAYFLNNLSSKFDFDFYFKASFDKANRTSIDSYRGPGLEKAMQWFSDLKSKLKIKVLTDIHECWQAKPLAEVCDGLQIPAFLCRQTDLLIAAVSTGAFINVKKGQFLSPGACQHIAQKIKDTAKQNNITPNYSLTERGNTFGYNDLIVDMRGISQMAKFGPVIFDVTHSCQKPSSQQTTQGQRESAALLARAAAATGYLSGFFLEVHPEPAKAKSDSQTQLNFLQAETLINQITEVCNLAKKHSGSDSQIFTG